MKPHAQPSPEQGELLVLESHDGLLSVVPADLETPQPQTDVTERQLVPAVDVRERAAHLLASLDAIAQVSKRVGFHKAEHTEEGHERLSREFGPHLDGVSEGVAFNRKTFRETAKTELLHAYNLGREVAVGIDDPDFDIAYKSFNFFYGGAKRRKERDAFGERLKKAAAIAGERQVPIYADAEQPKTADVPNFDATDIARTNPRNLREALFAAGRQSDEMRVDGVALSKRERAILVRSVPSLLEHVQKQADQSNMSANPIRREEAIIKAGVHALESKRADQARVLAAIRSEISDVRLLQEYLREPDAQRRVSEPVVRELAIKSHSYLDTILDVAAVTQRWSPEERRRAGKALDGVLYTSDGAPHMAAWTQAAELIGQYARARLSLFNNRQNAVTRAYSQQGIRLAVFYQEHGLNAV